MQPTLFITPEGFQQLVENVVCGANEKPIRDALDAFLVLEDCEWCGRRVGSDNLKDQLCPGCRMAIRARVALAEYLRKAAKE